MIMDKNLIFSEEQKITATANSEVIDLKEPGDAVGQELTIRVVSAETFAGLTGLQIKVQTGENAETFEDVLMTPSLKPEKLARGNEVFVVRVPKGLKRFVRLNYTVSGTATAGAVTAFMSKEL